MRDQAKTLASPGPPANASALDRARALAEGLRNTVRLSDALAASRRAVELKGLEAAVGLLCAQALDLEPAQGRALLPDLCAVLEAMTALSGTLAGRGPP